MNLFMACVTSWWSLRIAPCSQPFSNNQCLWSPQSQSSNSGNCLVCEWNHYCRTDLKDVIRSVRDRFASCELGAWNEIHETEGLPQVLYRYHGLHCRNWKVYCAKYPSRCNWWASMVGFGPIVSYGSSRDMMCNWLRAKVSRSIWDYSQIRDIRSSSCGTS